MLFASHIFLFVFLPLVLLGYFGLNRCCRSAMPGRIFLCGANFLFYGWFNFSYLWILLASIGVNFTLGRGLYAANGWRRRMLLVAGLLFNVGMIGYYKYADFFIRNVNALFSLDWPTRHILLPLGISFFTFQQIAYLVSIYRGELAERYDLPTFTLFISFFPQLIAGPIVLPGEMMPQFEDRKNLRFDPAAFAPGLWLFAIGLAKKLILADNLAPLADGTFAQAAGGAVPDLATAWRGAFAYTLQIYFDFSGYCDMALGIGRMFNIVLPLNFDSPYRSPNIREFWRRWHITLGRFLAQFVYFPLGGSRKGELRAHLALLTTFLVSGLWHGAGWTFVLWGGIHGIAMCVQRFFSRQLKLSLHAVAALPLTFLFVLGAWVLFRAENIAVAGRVYRGMFDFSEESLKAGFGDFSLNNMTLILAALGIVMVLPDAAPRIRDFKPTVFTAAATAVLLGGAVLFMARVSPFIYFNF